MIVFTRVFRDDKRVFAHDDEVCKLDKQANAKGKKVISNDKGEWIHTVRHIWGTRVFT